jgi:EAL domain-containing protein (putative c-di-GMP-specific phosphodiesterase class I)/GGDEF domain-containing protein
MSNFHIGDPEQPGAQGGIAAFLPRQAFVERLDAAIARSDRATLEHLWLGVVGIPRLNYFKAVMGIDAGEDLLRSLARLLSQEYPDALVFGRLESEELAVASLGPMKRRSRRLEPVRDVRFIGEALEVFGQELFVRLCAGVAQYGPSDDASSLLQNGCHALSCAYDLDTSDIVFFSNSLAERTQRRLEMLRELLPAIEHNELALQYMPLVALKTRRITGVEALVRWSHPTRGMLPPLEFIPDAERSGLIIPLGEWVLQTAIRQAGVWKRQGCGPFRMAVNLSPIQFLQANLADTIAALLRVQDLDPAWLDLEITETAILVDAKEALTVLRRLCDLGVGMTLDDFGSGYTCLRYLKQLPVQRLKIDREFIHAILSGEREAALVRSIIDIASTLGMRVIAEGVQNEAQVQWLLSAGCYEAQGFYFAPPLEREVVTSLLVKAAAISGGGPPPGT